MYDRLRGQKFLTNSEVALNANFFQICLFEEGETLWFVWENDRLVSYYCDSEHESICLYLRLHHLDFDTLFSDRGRPIYDMFEKIVWFINTWRLYDV